MPLIASDVKLTNKLNPQLNAYADSAQNSLQASLGRRKANSQRGQLATGRVQGEYMGQELGRAANSASLGINDKLMALLGDTSYKDAVAEQEHQQQMALAKEIGERAKMNTGQEIAAVLQGNFGALGGQGMGIYDALKKQKSLKTQASGNPRLSAFNTGTSDSLYSRYNQPSYDSFTYEEPYDYKSNWR